VGRVIAADFSRKGKMLYTASLDGTILQYDLSDSRRFGRSFKLPAPHLAPRGLALPSAPILAASNNGRLFAAAAVQRAADQSSVPIFSAGRLHPVATISLASNRVIGAAAWARGRLVIGADRGLVQLWDVAGSKARPGPKLPGLSPRGYAGGLVRSLATGDGGRVIAAVDGWFATQPNGVPIEQGELAIWRNGKLVAKPLALHTFGDSVAISFDGSMVAVATDPLQGDADGRVLVVDTRHGRPERTIEPPNTGGSVTAVALSRDGTLATGTSSGIVRLWNARTGATVGHATLVAPAPVASISFSPDGRTFATSGGSTGGTRIWVTATQQQLGSDFPGGAGQWGSVAYTHDGRYLLADFGDGTAYRWPVSISAWEQHACAVAGRNFTREEWSRFIGDRSYSTVCPGR
jgi:WD40 repeat protein